MTAKPITSRQKRQLRSFVYSAIDEEVADTALDREGYQRLIMNGGEVQSDIRAIVRKYSAGNLYAREEVKPRYGYPSEYVQNRKSFEAQIDILRSEANFPFLNPDKAIKYFRETYPYLRKPNWVEGAFAILPISAIAKHCFPEVEDAAEQFCRATDLIIGKIEASGRPFHNYRKGQLTTDRYRQKSRATRMYGLLEVQQPKSDILVAGGQFGAYHGGQSARRALERMLGDEIPGGAFQGGTMALANPHRFVRFEELDIDMPADDFRPEDGSTFSYSPSLSFRGDRLKFGMSAVDGASESYGSLSFFLPQK